MRPSYKSIMKAHTHTQRQRGRERHTHNMPNIHNTAASFIDFCLLRFCRCCCLCRCSSLPTLSLSLSSLSACTMAAMLLSKTKVVHAALACVERGTEREATATCDASRCVVCFVGSTQTQRVLSNRDTHTHTRTYIGACICNSGS